MKSVNLLIKPASSLCNMRCRYCFYGNIADIRSVKSYGIMSSVVAEQVVRAAFSAAERGGHIMFAFQGGEPTLAGLPFFQNFLDLERRYAVPGVQVSHSIQTNGYLVDDQWAAFFAENSFLVGLSIDGTREIHNKYRPDAAGTSTWPVVIQALRLLQKRRVDFNLLCVVTRDCARRAQKVYRSLRALGGAYLQFIPCLDGLQDTRGNAEYSLTPEAYGTFLCNLFDAWYLDWKQGDYTSIRLFDDYVHLAMGQSPSSCAAAGRCGGYLVVEADGGLYPCDFFVLDEWQLGNITYCSIDHALHSEAALRFLATGQRRPAACADCSWLALCRGGCKRDWQLLGGQPQNYYCSAFHHFFAYAYPRIQEIAAAELRMQSRNPSLPLYGRNFTHL